MIILERSVCKEQWQQLHELIIRLSAGDKCTPVGKTGVLRITHGKLSAIYVIIAAGQPVAWLYLLRRREWKAWEIHQAFVLPELRGRGLAQRVYRAAVNVDGIILSSGATQSKSARALWLRFIQKNTFNIWAQDFNNLKNVADVISYETDLHCVLTIYQRNHTAQDVRLVAIRK